MAQKDSRGKDDKSINKDAGESNRDSDVGERDYKYDERRGTYVTARKGVNYEWKEEEQRWEEISTLRVPHKQKKKRKPNCSIYISNLTQDTTEEMLEEMFSKYGLIAKDSITGDRKKQLHRVYSNIVNNRVVCLF